MSAVLTPEQTHDQIDVSRVVHFVHDCQLHPDGRPVALPVVAMCGWRCHRETEGSQPVDTCAMCREQDRCPACGKAPGLE